MGPRLPTAEEDASINRGIALDPDNPELTAEDFARMRPFHEIFADLAAASEPSHVPNRTMRCLIPLEPAVLSQLEELGPNWQQIAGKLLKAAMALRKSPPRA